MKAKLLFKVLSSGLIAILILALIPFSRNSEIKYIERNSGKQKKEKVYGEAWLKWLYNNPVGIASTYTLIKRKFITRMYGERMDSPKSKAKIAGFIKEYNIDISICQKQEFDNFNDFFYRKFKAEARKIDSNANAITSPGDGKILAVADIVNQDFIVKGYKFNVKEYFQNEELAERYKDGSLIIVRLCPTDYHRYHFPYDGKIIKDEVIKGDYYSVSPFALKKKIDILTLNKRSYCEIDNPVIGKFIMSEVAATMVGAMENTYEDNNVVKGEERGFFKFGGSTVILFFQKDQIQIDKDLLENTLSGLETEVEMGERIAVIK